MGRDWKYWGSGSVSGSGSGKSNNNGSRTTTTKNTRRSHIQTSHAAAGTGTGTGCINAVFQLFDFHHFQPSTSNLWHQTVPSFKHLSEDEILEPSTTLKGAEAPRNSLEMIMDSSSSSSLTNSTPPIINPDQRLPLTNVHPMRIRVPNRAEDLSSECSSSPGAPKTPNLVARLMGLDLLPQTSPRTSSSSSTYSSATNSSLKSRNYHPNSAVKDSKTQTQLRVPNHAKFILDTDFLGSRSLPETPRISSERRSEVDFHRLSLQSNRENSSELIELSRKSTGRRDLRVLEEEEENRSPGFYARQIVKQVKDNISRKVGSDITNTVRNNNNHNKQSDQKQRHHGGVDDQIVLLKYKKHESRSTGDQDLASSNCSPRLRFLELKNRGANSQLSQTSKSSTQQTHVTTMSDVATTSKQHQSSSVPKEEKKQSSDQKCRELRRDQRLCLSSPNRSQPPSDPIKNKKEETFFRSKLGRKKEKPPDKKCKKTPLSTDLLTSNNVTNIFHLKRDPPSPLTKLPQKQEYKYNDAPSSERSVQEKTSTFQQNGRRDRSGTRHIFYPGNVGNRSWDLHDYVRRITAGVSINVTELYGSVDPAVFHRFEAEVSSSLKLFEGSASVPINVSLRCNRLLVFDLVNEFLGMEHSRQEMSKELAQTMCEKIKNFEFEAADCRVLEDIDAIIERDLRGVEETKMRIGKHDEERKGIIEEIQRQLIDMLLEETTSSLLCCYNN